MLLPPPHTRVTMRSTEGVWYDRLSPLVLERIIEEHLLGGHTVTSHLMLGARSSHQGSNVVPALDITR